MSEQHKKPRRKKPVYVPRTLEEQKALHKKQRLLRAEFEGKLTRKQRPHYRGFSFSSSGSE